MQALIQRHYLCIVCKIFIIVVFFFLSSEPAQEITKFETDKIKIHSRVGKNWRRNLVCCGGNDKAVYYQFFRAV